MPVLWLMVTGLFWKRSPKAAGVTLATVWIINSLWSFSKLPELLGMVNIPNSYIMLILTIVVGTVTNLMFDGKQKYFASNRYREQVARNTALKNTG